MTSVNLVSYDHNFEYVATLTNGRDYGIESVDTLVPNTRFRVTFEGGAQWEYNAYGMNQFQPHMNIVRITPVKRKQPVPPTWKELFFFTIAKKVSK